MCLLLPLPLNPLLPSQPHALQTTRWQLWARLAQVIAHEVGVLGEVNRLQRQPPQPLAPVDCLHRGSRCSNSKQSDAGYTLQARDRNARSRPGCGATQSMPASPPAAATQSRCPALSLQVEDGRTDEAGVHMQAGPETAGRQMLQPPGYAQKPMNCVPCSRASRNDIALRL